MAGWWDKRTSGEKILIPLCVVAIIGGGLIMLMPSGPPNKKLLSAADASQKYEDAAKEMKAKQTEIARLKPEIDELTFKDSPEQVIPRVIKTLQTTAGDSGIHIREIKPLRIRRVSGLTKVPLSVRFSCEFAKTVPFLYRTEDPANKLVVDRFNVTSPDPKSRIVDVEAHVSFYTSGTAGAETSSAGT